MTSYGDERAKALPKTKGHEISVEEKKCCLSNRHSVRRVHNLLTDAFQILDTPTAFNPLGENIAETMKVDERIIDMI